MYIKTSTYDVESCKEGHLNPKYDKKLYKHQNYNFHLAISKHWSQDKHVTWFSRRYILF